MSQRKSIWIGGGIAVALVVVIIVVIALAGRSSGSSDAAAPSPTATEQQSTSAEQQTADASTFARQLADDPRAIGDVDAPVLMVEFADLRCHYCAVFANDTLPGLLSEYVDAGLLRIEWHSAVVLGDTSEDAAVAAFAAAEQSMFWEYVEALYATEPTGATVWDRTALVGLAEQVGLDIERFSVDLDDPTVIAAAEAEAAQSTAYGVTGTPAFVVGNQLITGAQPLEAFVEVIDAQLP